MVAPVHCGREIAAHTVGIKAKRSFPPELALQLDLGAFQSRALRLGQVLAGAVDVEGKHRQR